MNVKELVRSKSAWTGLASVVTGIFAIKQGAVEVGILAIIGGMGMIFIKDAIVTSTKDVTGK